MRPSDLKGAPNFHPRVSRTSSGEIDTRVLRAAAKRGCSKTQYWRSLPPGRLRDTRSAQGRFAQTYTTRTCPTPHVERAEQGAYEFRRNFADLRDEFERFVEAPRGVELWTPADVMEWFDGIVWSASRRRFKDGEMAAFRACFEAERLARWRVSRPGEGMRLDDLAGSCKGGVAHIGCFPGAVAVDEFRRCNAVRKARGETKRRNFAH